MLIVTRARNAQNPARYWRTTIHISLQFAMIRLVVWSAIGDGSALTSTDAFVQVIVSSIRTNRVRCALYKKILDLLDEETISGESSGRASI